MQAEAIDQIYDDSIYSADNIIQGNKYLTKAKESNSSFRKFVLLFLIVASIVLLFLDWYD